LKIFQQFLILFIYLLYQFIFENKIQTHIIYIYKVLIIILCREIPEIIKIKKSIWNLNINFNQTI
jgi:hypothetical protein